MVRAPDRRRTNGTPQEHEHPERARAEAEVYQRSKARVRELREIARIDKHLEMDDRYNMLPKDGRTDNRRSVASTILAHTW